MPNFSIFASRTTWTVIAMFVIGGLGAVIPMIPAPIQALAMALLTPLAVYFHVNPSQQYNAGGIQR